MFLLSHLDILLFLHFQFYLSYRGGKGSSPYTTDAQIATAAGMGKIASSISSEFVVALGDNYYSNGITTNENDSRFCSSQAAMSPR